MSVVAWLLIPFTQQTHLSWKGIAEWMKWIYMAHIMADGPVRNPMIESIPLLGEHHCQIMGV